MRLGGLAAKRRPKRSSSGGIASVISDPRDQWRLPRAPEELVRRLMGELGLVACQPAPLRPVTTVQGQGRPGRSRIW